MLKTNHRAIPRRNSESRGASSFFKLLCLGLLLLCVIVSLGIVVVLRERSERARLAARVAKLSAEGSPVDDASLESLYVARTSTEMLAQWNKVFQMVRNESESTASVEDEALIQRLEALRTEIAIAVSSDRPCRFIEDFEATNTLLPYLSRLRSTTKLLTRHAQASINCGEVDTAIEDCELILGCADAISADPFAIPAMVSISFQSGVLDVYRTCIEDDLLSESQLNRILNTCRSRGAIGERWKLLISGERAMTLALLTDDVYEESVAVQDPYFRWLGVSGSGTNNIADFFDKLEAVPTDDLQLMQVELKSIYADWNQSVNGSILAKIENRLSSEIISDFERIGNLVIQSVSRYRMTAIAVGLRLYQKRFGEFPESLDELQRVGIKSNELLTLTNTSFSYLRNPTNVRLADDDESWLPPTGSSTDADREWTLSVEAGKNANQKR